MNVHMCSGSLRAAGTMLLIPLLLTVHRASSIQFSSSSKPPTHPRNPRQAAAALHATGATNSLIDDALADRRTFVRDLAVTSAAAATSASIIDPSNAVNAEEVGEHESWSTAILSDLNSKKGPVGWDLIGGGSSTSSAIDPPYANIRYGTSTLASSAGRSAPCARSPPTRYPDWMEGTWLATYTFVRATFPQGRGALSLRVPGAGIGTVLSLPNVGYNPAPFAVRYLRGDSAATNDSNPGMMTASGVYEDLAYNFPRRLEAFWPDAKVLSVRTGNSYKGGRNGCSAIAVEEDENKLLLTPPCSVTGDGCTAGENPKLHSPATRLSLDYEGPTRAGPRRSQTIDCSAVQGIAVGPSEGGAASVVTSKQFVQYNVQQDLQAYYKEICSFRRVADDSESQTIEGKMRVAAFVPHILQGTDGNDPPKHDERLALALYDYRITLKRLSEEAEAII